MFFFLDYCPNSAQQLTSKIVEEIPDVRSVKSQVLYLNTGAQQLQTWTFAGDQFILLGDPVFKSDQAVPSTIIRSDGGLNEALLYEHIKGHYYWFLLQDQEIRCGSSFGAIFPIYFVQRSDKIKLCSSAHFLAKGTGGLQPNHRNLLERLLFNYPFFNSTWWREMSLLPAHRHLHLNNQGTEVKGQFDISHYFGTVQDRTRDSLQFLTDYFQKETQRFFPDKSFAISLTGGFDGRTLVAAAAKAGKQFGTYSFGRPESSDVTFPAGQAKKLGIPYKAILLDQRYIREEAMDAGHRFMQLTDYNGNYSRPHYEYAARSLSTEVDYIITGNFGSELFRALHLPGVMMSESLIQLFSATDESWKDSMKGRLKLWGMDHFRKEFDALVSDLENYLQLREGWDRNHKFYDFVFNEIFRKYFGPELVMQSHYFNNRTPYLNLEFFRALNSTIWSGVHARLFEKTKAKRMKGQVFYATFIRESHKKLYHLPTNKGYSPADVLEGWRFPFLVGKVVLKKFLQKPEMDSNAVEAYFRKDFPKMGDMTNGDGIPKSFSKYLSRSKNDLANGAHVQEWIRLYSVLAGWQAAQPTITHPTSLL